MDSSVIILKLSKCDPAAASIGETRVCQEMDREIFFPIKILKFQAQAAGIPNKREMMILPIHGVKHTTHM